MLNKVERRSMVIAMVPSSVGTYVQAKRRLIISQLESISNQMKVHDLRTGFL